jgi:hypothetical protein
MNRAESTAVVTGPNRGFGRHLAGELVARGAAVYAAASNPDTVDVLGAKAGTLDVTAPKSVAAAAEIAGDLTLLINNSGSRTGAGLLDGDLDGIRLETRHAPSGCSRCVPSPRESPAITSDPSSTSCPHFYGSVSPPSAPIALPSRPNGH